MLEYGESALDKLRLMSKEIARRWRGHNDDIIVPVTKTEVDRYHIRRLRLVYADAVREDSTWRE